ncbi:hypothetical protein TRFO_32794 [Tritrichomonas foetus]|uniref:Uncharacterized protein n=1 Tax=Tritrichomonas foetus TaxID=1144522 RepID=A0A1J4JN29_9EUKA|nr:hypothetical protein TRFO_32794 [Tritrichomonas foetus]|eukprot:OHT00483.1 hypothetical protein TRFO_32794 [Tritrichomonas foetus]
MNSSNVYSDYVPEVIISKTKDIYHNTVEELMQMSNSKEDDILKKFSNWPRSNETVSTAYIECINDIVTVGLPFPDLAINVLLQLVNINEQEKGKLNEHLKADFGVEKKNALQQIVFSWLIYFIFADSVAQLITYSSNYTDPTILSICESLVEKNLDVLGKEFKKFQKLFEHLLIKILKQCSVLAAHFAKEKNQYDQAINSIELHIFGTQNKDSTKIARRFTLYRFLHHGDKSLMFTQKYLLPLLQSEKKTFILEIIYDAIKWAILQIPKTSESKLEKLSKEFNKSNDIIKRSLFEFKAILLARTEDIDFHKIAKLLRDPPKGTEPESFLKGFLYILRGPNFVPNNEFWEFGERNGEFKLALEKTQILTDLTEGKPHKKGDSKEIGDETSFCGLFLRFVANELYNCETATKIIFNLLSRNLIESASILITEINKNSQKGIADRLIGPFLSALTLVFDVNTGFIDNKTITIDQINNLKISIKSLIHHKYLEYKYPSAAEKPSACRTVSVQLCPNTISPNDEIIPESFTNAYRQRIEDAQKKIEETNLPKGRENIEDVVKVLVKYRKGAESQIPIYLISLLYQTINKSDSTKHFFIPMVNAANSSEGKLAFFALYALQVYYIKKEFCVLPILLAINQVMKDTICQKNAFTLLNLLYQLLSLPRMNVLEEDMDTFTQWTAELQAILLAQLTSPYAIIRDMVLLVMQRLDTICSDYQIDTTICSLMLQYNVQMTKRVASRLVSSGNNIKSFDKISFNVAARSSQLLIYQLYLSEYAQVLLRPEMKSVLEKFWELKLWDRIKIPSPKGTIDNIDQYSWETLPIIAFTQRIVPLQKETADIIFKNYHLLPNNHSLTVYEIFQRPLIGGINEQNILKQRIKFWNKNIPILCQFLVQSDEKWPFETLASVANSSCIELMPTFISKTITSLSTLSAESKNFSITCIIRFSCLLRCVALAPDFALIAATQINDIKIIFTKFFDWYHKTFKSLGIKCDLNNLTLNYHNQVSEDQIDDLVSMYSDCVRYFSRAFTCANNIGSTGAIRAHIQPSWLTNEEIWPIKSRRESFEYLICATNSNFDRNKTLSALVSLIESVDIFDEQYPIKDKYYKYFLELESQYKDYRILYHLLLHHPNIFNDILTSSIQVPINFGFYFFRAICENFPSNNNEINVDELSETDVEENEKVVDKSGYLIVSALLFIGSSHEGCRQCAFNLLKRVSPILCTFNNQKDITAAAEINAYLEKHRGELCVYSFAPTLEQCFELSAFIAKNMRFIIPKVFDAFFTFFAHIDNNSFTNIDDIYIPLLLNAIAPFFRQITLDSTCSAYPDDFKSKTDVRAIDVITSLFNFYPALLKTHLLYYSRIFGEIFFNSENVNPLSKLVVMLASNDPSYIAPSTTVLIYLVQKEPAIVLTILTQRLTFGHWFTDSIGSKILTEKPYNILDWINLTLNVLKEVALANFSLLFPYIHYVIHFCLIFNNRMGGAVHSLLQAITHNFGIDQILTSTHISFTSKTPNDSLSIKEIVYHCGDYLQRIFPLAISAWTTEALQWATSCGDLSIAHDSAVIYSFLLSEFRPCDSTFIISSLNEVLAEYSLNQKLLANTENVNELYSFIHGCIKMLGSNTKAASKVDAISSLSMVFNIASVFLEAVLDDEETANLALQVMLTFIDSKFQLTSDQLMPHLINVAKMLPVTFNEPNVAKFLISLIFNLPASTSQKIKVISLCLLLPIYYAGTCAYHSINPYSTFIQDDLVIDLFECADKLGKSEFAGDSRYSEIFIKYFENDQLEAESRLIDRKRPIDLINELTAEVWRSDSENIQELGIIFHSIVSIDVKDPSSSSAGLSSKEIRSAIFAVVKSFIDTCPESKLLHLSSFSPIMSVAISDNGVSARDLISRLSEVTANSDIKSPIYQKLPQLEQLNQQDIIKELTAHIQEQSAFMPLLKEENIYFNDPTSQFKVLMICLKCEKHLEQQMEALNGVKFQPFDEQMKFWTAANQAIESKKKQNLEIPEAFDFYAQAMAMTPISRNTKNIALEKSYFEPQCFILRDEEFDAFEKRLNLE